jgi:DMSO/TMAO reductase YedYZ molybdopterin-dependent catalytic subunit
MAMNRRNVLVGLGAVAVGGGAAFGSGAFSQVSANRTVDLQSTGDNSALVTLSPTTNAEAAVSSGSELQLELKTLNQNAKTELGDEFTITLNDAADKSTNYDVSISGTSDSPLSISLSEGPLSHDGSWNEVTASVTIDLTGSANAGGIPSSIDITVSESSA